MKKLVSPDMDLLNLDSYWNASKRWRDDVSLHLLSRICNSSAKFRDDLFSETAMPPEALATLGDENNRTGGAVETYIYHRFDTKHIQLANSLNYCIKADLLLIEKK